MKSQTTLLLSFFVNFVKCPKRIVVALSAASLARVATRLSVNHMSLFQVVHGPVHSLPQELLHSYLSYSASSFNSPKQNIWHVNRSNRFSQAVKIVAAVKIAYCLTV